MKTPAEGTTLTIGELAEATGVSTATLRFYEARGLLGPSGRRSNGYRYFGIRDQERLRFIGRAKQLGCKLDEIASLLQVWDGGRCGPIQTELRDLVVHKVVEAQERLLDTTVFIAELQRAAADLDGHRPVGACDERCGCVSEPTSTGLGITASTPVRIAHEPPIACRLPPDQMPDRLADFQRLSSKVRRRVELERGIRLEFANGAIDVGEVAQLLADETRCCPFWEFSLEIAGNGVAIEVRGPQDAKTLIDALFGVAT